MRKEKFGLIAFLLLEMHQQPSSAAVEIKNQFYFALDLRPCLRRHQSMWRHQSAVYRMKTVFHFGNYKKQCTNSRAEKRRSDVVERNLIRFSSSRRYFSSFRTFLGVGSLWHLKTLVARPLCLPIVDVRTGGSSLLNRLIRVDLYFWTWIIAFRSGKTFCHSPGSCSRPPVPSRLSCHRALMF